MLKFHCSAGGKEGSKEEIMAAWGFSSSTDPLGPSHCSNSPATLPSTGDKPSVPFLKYTKVSMVRKRKSKCIRFWTRCLHRNFRWNLGHEEGQAAQFETALDFLLLSSWPTTALWGKSLGGWQSKGVFSKVTQKETRSQQGFPYEHLLPPQKNDAKLWEQLCPSPYKSLQG